MSINKEQMRDIYTRMCRIRAFETAAARLFAEGKIYGFAHLYLGEEAIARLLRPCASACGRMTSSQVHTVATATSSPRTAIWV